MHNCPKCGTQSGGLPPTCRNELCSNFGKTLSFTEKSSNAARKGSNTTASVEHLGQQIGVQSGAKVAIEKPKPEATWSWAGSIVAALVCATGRGMVTLSQGASGMAIAVPLSAFIGLLIGALVGGLGRPVMSPILGSALSWLGDWLLLLVYRLIEVALVIVTIGAYQNIFRGEGSLLFWMAFVGAASGALGAVVANVSRRLT